jgi:hypothetical protein
MGEALVAVAAASDDRIVTTALGAMRLGGFLDTRTFELVVHTGDLRRALGVTGEPPESAAAVTLQVLAGLALRHGRVTDVIAVLTGRQPLGRVSVL